MSSGYHGSETSGLTAYIGMCITPDEIAAEHYAAGNGADEGIVYEVDIDDTDLVVADVEYDYDGCEPILAGVAADIAVFTDCDETGRTHQTWMLLTAAAVTAATVH